MRCEVWRAARVADALVVCILAGRMVVLVRCPAPEREVVVVV